VLKEIEGMIKCRLSDKFDLVFGTSTGAIITGLVCLGYSVDDIHALYKEHVVKVMRLKKAPGKSAALEALAAEVFKQQKFDAEKTAIGIVTTKWMIERPMIFKGTIAHSKPAQYTLAAFKADVSTWLARQYETDFDPSGSKALYIKERHNKRERRLTAKGHRTNATAGLLSTGSVPDVSPGIEGKHRAAPHRRTQGKEPACTCSEGSSEAVRPRLRP
jgi:Patatin-like phospholipase